MAFLKAFNLVKKYEEVVAVDDISFEIEQGEFLTLLGPSGCGKTTTLRLIAGLENSDRGEIYIGDRLVQSSKKNIFVEPDKRGFGMVFQSYAIWPHMTVAQNIAYPLVERKLAKAKISEMVEDVLDKVKLSGLGDRSATKLSGGQQQRVALARALVYNPEILLFDEPLSNLDAKLRIEMRNEIRSLQKNLGITSVYVTHDQEEAFALSDRIIVMKDGKIEQMGDQDTLYFRPKTSFVTQFIGQTNLVEGIVDRVEGGQAYVKALGTEIRINYEQGYEKGTQIHLSIRPEYIRVNPEDKMDNSFEGKVIQRQYLGSHCNYLVSVGDTKINVETHGITDGDIITMPGEGEPLSMGFYSKDCLSFFRPALSRRGEDHDQNTE